MKAYAVIGLLLLSNAAGSEMVDFSECAPAIAENADASFRSRNYDLEPEGAAIESLSETMNNLENRVYFYLYTKDNPINRQRLLLDDVVRLQSSNFNFSRPTKILTHGWVNTVYDDAVNLLRDAYLQHGDYNIVAIDWSQISFKPYLWASERVLMVSKFSADFINFLHKQGLDLSTLTIAGHSLGAHVAGLAARYTEGNVDLVVAMDPALPNFAISKPGERVARGDAKYVLVIHTNAGVSGFEMAIGDVDFYPNSGRVQPGCVGNTCSHSSSYRYFAESINSDKFVAVECKSCAKFNSGQCKSNAKAIMGGVNPDRKVKGTYFLKTNTESPYALGEVA